MIGEFKGKYRFLSNFYPASILYEGLEYACSENAYQAAKTDQIAVRNSFRHLTPFEAKRRGNIIVMDTGFVYRRREVMLDIVRIKFSSHSHLAQKLVDTRDEELQEGNYWGDIYWGIVSGVGENHLGKILMQVRKELQCC